MKHLSPLPHWSTLLLATLALAPAATAATLTTVQNHVTGYGSTGPDTGSFDNIDETTIAGQTLHVTGATYEAASIGSAATGILHGHVFGSVDGPGTIGGVDTSTFARGIVRGAALDTLTLSIAGLPSGTPGLITFSYSLAETRTLFGGGIGFFASNQLLFQVNDGTSPYTATDGLSDHGYLFSTDGIADNNLPAGGTITYELNVTTGTPFNLQPHLTLIGQAEAVEGQGAGSFDMNASAYWNGVSQVTLGGVPVSGFSLINGDGVDFTGSFAPAAVPEPEHYAALAGTGLLAFALWRRAQKRA